MDKYFLADNIEEMVQTCLACGVSVDKKEITLHAKWHDRIETEFSRLLSILLKGLAKK